MKTPDTAAQVNSLVADTHQCARRGMCPEDTEALSLVPLKNCPSVSLHLAGPDLHTS